MGKGAVVLVVGPSGAGKDSLLRGARAALAHDQRFVFPRRVVTRVAVAELEDHDTMSPDAFATARERGAFALDWQAHGLSYGIPVAIDAEIGAGRICVVNASRRVIAPAIARYARCQVMMVTARPDILASRLASRGRETAEDIARRLAREAPLPAGAEIVTIDNSGTLAEGVEAFTLALLRVAPD